MQSTFFLKMIEINLTDFSNLKGSFMNINQLFINIGIRGSKQIKKGPLNRKKIMFKLCESSYSIWPGASYMYVLFMLLSIINKLSRGLVFYKY